MLLTKNWFSVQTAHKKQKSIRKYFPAPFLPFLPKLGTLQPPKFIGHEIFLAAPFELCCRIFGYLATVFLPLPRRQPCAHCVQCTLYSTSHGLGCSNTATPVSCSLQGKQNTDRGGCLSVI